MTTTATDLTEIKQVRAEADCLYTQAQVDAAICDMAAAINQRLVGRDPLVFCVMVGGLLPTAWLLPQLRFPVQLDYIHASRYRGRTRGEEIHWIRPPGQISGREVLVIDDILDEGHTLQAIVQSCRAAGAAEVLTAVLADKQVERPDGLQQADFTGLSVPDRYVFGSGMDYKHYLRNAPGIYAVRNS